MKIPIVRTILKSQVKITRNMKTFGIAAAIITVIGILGWIVVQTLKTDNSDSAYNMHPSNFEKPDLEHTIQFEEDKDIAGQIIDLPDSSDDEKEPPTA